MKKTIIRTAGIAAALVAALVIVSCPEPFTISDLDILEDILGPELTISEPNEGDLYQDTVTVSGTAIDVGESGELRLLDDPAALPTLTWSVTGEDAAGTIDVATDGSFTIQIPTTDYSEDIAIELTSIDQNKNETTLIRRLLYDSRGPNISVSDPVERSVFGKLVSVTGTVANSDNSVPTNVASLSYEVVNTVLRDDIPFDADTGAFTFGFNTTGISEDLIIRIQASDSQGDVSTFYRQLANDGEGPAISVTSPADYSEFVSTITVVGNVANSDTDSNLDEVNTLSYTAISGTQSGFVAFDTDDGGFSFTVDATGINSDIVVTLIASDIHGHGTTRSIVLLNDDSGPYIVLTSPVDGYFSTVIELAGNVQNGPLDTGLTEVDLTSVAYRIPGTVISGTFASADTDDGSFSADIDVSTISTNIVFEVSALDLNGNETIAQVNLLKPAGGGDINVGATAENGAIIFTWDDVPGATNYRIEEFVFGGIRDGVALDGFGQYTWDGLQNGTFHEFQILATVPGYETAVSSDIVIAPMSQMTFRSRSVNSNYGSIDVEWAASETAGARFLLERQTNGGAWETLAVTTANSYTDSDVAKSNSYRYRLTLRNNGQDVLNQSIESVAFRSPYFPNEATVANEIGSNSFHVVEKYEDILYLCDQYSVLYAYDVSNPYFPTQPTTIANAGTRFHRIGATSYAAVYGDSDDTVNIVDLDTVSIAASFDHPYAGTGLVVQSISSSGTNLYVAVGDRNETTTDTGAVFIYDISVPESPVYTEAFAVEPAGIIVYGNYLFIAKEKSGGGGELLVADVTIPSAVTITPTGLMHANNNNNRVNMTIGGTYLFVRDDGGVSMRAYNISTASSPFEVANGGFNTFGGGDLFLDGTMLYIADLFAGGFGALDVTDILNGTEDGEVGNLADPPLYDFALDTDTADIFVEDGIMWTAQFNGGTVVVDLGIPTGITELSPVVLSGGAGDTNSILADGDRLLVLSGSTATATVDSLHVLDIGTDPENPVEQEAVDVSAAFSWPDIGIAGDIVFLPSADTIDIGQSPPVYQDSLWYPDSFCYKIQLLGEFAVLGTIVSDGITILNVSKPANPVEEATMLKGGQIAVEIFDNYVVSATTSEVFLIDISDPDAPLLLDTFAMSGVVTQDLIVDRNYVSVLDGDFVEVLQIDLTGDPLSDAGYSLDLGSVLTHAEVLVQGDMLLVRSDNDLDTTKVSLFDISDLAGAGIVEIASLTLPSLDTDSMAWVGNIVYLGDNDARRIVVLKIE